jgi:hypothetical protein
MSEEQPSIEPLPHQYGLGPTGKGALAAAVALVSAAYPPAAVPLAGVGAGLQALGEKFNSLQQARTAELLAAASEESSQSLEDVVAALVERDDLALMAAEALDAARRSRLPGKARVLGRALGSILADDALIDLESVWIRVLTAIEPPHVRIMGLFLEHTGTMGTGSKLWGKGTIVKVSDIGEKLGLGQAVLPLIQDLIRSGCLMDPGASGMTYELPDAYGQSLVATDVGAQLFARLSVAGIDEGK